MSSQMIKSGALRRTRFGAGAPSGVYAPAFIGEEYYDNAGEVWYKARGLTSSDWMAVSTHDGGWRDMIGQIVPRANVPTSPTWTQMGTSPFWAYLFALNDEVWIPFHIQHDYKPGTDIYLHVHWTTNGTSTATTKWQFDYCFAKGFNQGNFDVGGNRSTTVEQAAAGTAWRHMVAEISTPISDANFEVDGLLLVHIKRITNGGTNNTDNVFLLVSDCHYQSDMLNTKNRTPDFYA